MILVCIVLITITLALVAGLVVYAVVTTINEHPFNR